MSTEEDHRESRITTQKYHLKKYFLPHGISFINLYLVFLFQKTFRMLDEIAEIAKLLHVLWRQTHLQSRNVKKFLIPNLVTWILLPLNKNATGRWNNMISRTRAVINRSTKIVFIIYYTLWRLITMCETWTQPLDQF